MPRRGTGEAWHDLYIGAGICMYRDACPGCRCAGMGSIYIGTAMYISGTVENERERVGAFARLRAVLRDLDLLRLLDVEVTWTMLLN